MGPCQEVPQSEDLNPQILPSACFLTPPLYLRMIPLMDPFPDQPQTNADPAWAKSNPPRICLGPHLLLSLLSGRVRGPVISQSAGWGVPSLGGCVMVLWKLSGCCATFAWVLQKEHPSPSSWALWIDFQRLLCLGWELCGVGCGFRGFSCKTYIGGRAWGC